MAVSVVCASLLLFAFAYFPGRLVAYPIWFLDRVSFACRPPSNPQQTHVHTSVAYRSIEKYAEQFDWFLNLIIYFAETDAESGRRLLWSCAPNYVHGDYDERNNNTTKP